MFSVVFLAGSAFGQADVRNRAALARPFVVDVREFGAKADDRTDNALAFQTAIDTLAARMKKLLPPGHRTVGTVLIPAAPHSYKTSKPVWVDHSFIEIRGEGAGTKIETFPGYNHPLFLFGLRRSASFRKDGKDIPLIADAAYRPDAFGRLDASAAPKPGDRRGFRSRGDALIQAQATPLSDGPRHSRADWTTDHWTETRALTIESAVEVRGATLPASLPLFGMGVATSDKPSPVLIHTGEEGQVWIAFATQSEAFGPRTCRKADFRVPSGRGVRRLTVQIDLDKATVAAFVDGVQVVTGNHLGDDFKPGLKFAENDYFPLLIGDAGGDRPALGASNGIDWILYGLLFTKTLRYREDGAGRPQRRVDKPDARLDDRYRYFTLPGDDPGQIGHFSFTDDPAIDGRLLTIQGGPAANQCRSVAFLQHSMSNNQGGIHENAIRDVHLVGGHLYGQNIAVAQVLDLKISGVRSTDAYHAIGSFSHGANYTIKLEDCTLQGNDSGYFGLDQMVWGRNVTFAGAGRVTMRFVGCVVKMQNTMVLFASTDNQSTVKMHAGDYGGNYTFDFLVVDYEGAVYSHTPIYCESHPYAAQTSLRLTDVLLGSVGENVPIITLRDASPNCPRAYLSVDNLQAMSKKVAAAVDVDGPIWRGEIRGLMVGDGPNIRYRGKPGTSSKIVVHE